MTLVMDVSLLHHILERTRYYYQRMLILEYSYCILFSPLNRLVFTTKFRKFLNKRLNLGRTSPLVHIDAIYNTGSRIVTVGSTTSF